MNFANNFQLLQELTERYLSGFGHATVPGTWLAFTVLGVVVLSARAPKKPWLQRLTLALPLAAGAVWGAYQLRWIGDDAFISFRYAQNFASGSGLTFNPGERVEGYTNFLWTILMSLGMLLGVNPILTSILLSLSSLAAVILLLQNLTADLYPGRDLPPLSLAATVAATSYVMLNFGTSGLETMFAAALGLGMLFTAIHGRWLLSGSLGIASALSHPDHILLYASLGLALLADPKRVRTPLSWWKDRAARSVVLRFSAPFLLVFLPYFFLRWSYYGDFYPNTYYAKSGNLAYFSQGFKYLLITLFAVGGFVLVPMAFVGAWRFRSDLVGRYFYIVFPLFSLYVAKIGGDFMLGRVLITLLPLTLLLAESALLAFSEIPGWPRRVALIFGVPGLFLASLPVRVVNDGEKFWHVSDERSFYPITHLSEQGVVSHYRKRALDLEKHVLAHGYDPLLGAGNVGVVGFLSQVRIVDILALTDRSVAHMPITHRSRPGHEKIARGAYLLERQVDLSDDQIFPEPYSRQSQGKVGNTTYFLSGYKPTLIKALQDDQSVRIPDMEKHLRQYAGNKTPLDPNRLACDAWFFDVYYFKHNHSPELAGRIIERWADALSAEAGWVKLHLPSLAAPEWTPRTIFDFEDLEGWTKEGQAFRDAPTRGLVADQGFVFGAQDAYANSFQPRLGDRPTGELLSPPFVVRGEVLTVDVGGGDANVGAELLIQDHVVRSAAGCNAEMLGRKVWNTKEFQGQEARLRIFDRSSANWGHVQVDQLVEWTRVR